MTQGTNKKPAPNYGAILKNGLILGSTAFVCLGLVFTVSHFTEAKIKADQIKKENARFATLLPAGSFDNALAKDCHLFKLEDGRTVKLLSARLKNKVTGYIVSYDINGGYAVPFKMTAGVTLPDFAVHYLEVDVFNETPGLGDKILRNKGSFLDSFNGATPKNRKWEVKKYGGDFDYFTGATVTPRAVVRSTGSVLEALAKTTPEAINALPLCNLDSENEAEATVVAAPSESVAQGSGSTQAQDTNPQATNASSKKHDGATGATAKADGATGASSKAEHVEHTKPSKPNKDGASKKHDGATGATPKADGATGATPKADGATGASSKAEHHEKSAAPSLSPLSSSDASTQASASSSEATSSSTDLNQVSAKE